MSHPNPIVVLVHGAFAESARWIGVIEKLSEQGIDAVAAANPLRSVTGDAEYVRDVIAGLGRPVLLVGHSYGGMVITEAASDNPNVVGLVYVAAFAPDQGESALQLSVTHPGSTLGEALRSYPVSSGGNELAIRLDAFHTQFAADVPATVAEHMARTQRPATEYALSEGLPTSTPAWKTLPSWFVIGVEDHNIPAAALRVQAERAAARGVREVAGGSHAVAVSRPDEVAASIAEAFEACVADAAA
ncbi:alpha/beta hydrolase [Nocardioides sp. YIM 152315]|uniref:alpha/beta fold hydrolase n=1 Tax=Nocardioides sp. YIM 152315 TaxID=3031760 RepID=UPI0023DADB2A|nr:alpha/beta hydrolase [Nocardioides sp. YIM 152315]MDF1602026.1 alpha/beta hydrolase [Nocardioides sp. YIM 152315]